MNYRELLQLTKGWGNFISDRINIWRLQKDYLRRMEKDDTFVAYEDNNYLLMTDSANDIEIVKKAILKMLQPNIYFDID